MAKKVLFFILSCITIHLPAQMLKPLGQGITDEVIASTTDNTFLYVATRKQNAGTVKTFTVTINKWNGFYWQQLPGITFSDSSFIKSMAIYKNQVYLAGNFVVKTPAITSTKTLVRFNTNTNKWEAVLVNGTVSFSFLGGGYGTINTMAVYKNQLFIAGAFYTVVNGDTTQNIVTYNGINFSKCGVGGLGNTGTNGTINSLFVLNDSLFLGGYFTKAGGLTSGNLAVIDSNFSWKSLSISTSLGVAKLTSFQNNLAILTSDLQGKIYIRNNGVFQPISSNLSANQINDIEEFNGELWASGGFYSGAATIVKYNTSWSSSGLPLATATEIIKFRNGLFFVTPNDFAGNIRINKIAQIVFFHTRISGHVYQDVNHNCKFDNGDKPFANKIVRIQATENFNVTTDADGYYATTLPIGAISYTASLMKFKNWEIDSPCSRSTYLINPLNNSIYDTLDFSLKAIAAGADIKVNITPNSGYSSRRDLVEAYTITYTNNGTQDITSAAGIKVVFDKKLSNFTSSQSYVLNGNEASWSIGALKVGEQRSIRFTAQAKSDSFKLYDKVNFIASSGLADLDAQDNSDTLELRIEQTSTGPVLKDVYPLPAVDDSFSLVTTDKNEINYIIHFENTSTTDTIHNIIVIDTIDINSSIQYVQETGSSHNYTTKIYGCPPALGKGVIVWTFNNIKLPPFEHNDDVTNRGHIGFKIKFNSNLPLGTVIKNKANIIFDYYEPITTNNTYAKVSEVMTGIQPQKQVSFQERICVNPVNKEIILFKDYAPNSNYKIINAAGAIISAGSINAKTIAVSGLASGIYFLMIESDNHLFSQKIIIN